MKPTFPRREWERRQSEDLGFSSDKLAAAETWLKDLAGDTPCTSLGLVVSQNPGIWASFRDEAESVQTQNDTLARIRDAIIE